MSDMEDSGGATAVPPAPITSTFDSDSFEKRIAGLNTAVNRKAAELATKDQALQTSVAETAVFRTLAATHENALAAMRQQFDEFQKASEVSIKERDDAKQSATNATDRLNAIQRLVDRGHTDILPLVTKGMFSPNMESDEALDASVIAFKNTVANLLGITEVKRTSGATPPRPGAPEPTIANSLGMSYDEMWDFLMLPSSKNNPNFETISNLYNKETLRRHTRT